MYKTFILSLFFVGSMVAQTLAADVVPTNLTCNYMSQPLAVAGRPSLGWQLATRKNNVRQTAYELELYRLSSGRPTVFWQSGKCASPHSQHIRLDEGVKLLPDERYAWRVRVWCSDNRPSRWSRMQHFRTAPHSLAHCQWIGAIDRKDAHIPQGRHYHGVQAPAAAYEPWAKADTLSKRSIYVRKEFDAAQKVREAIVHISGLGHYELSINGRRVGQDVFAPLWTDYDKTVYYNTFDVTPFIGRRNAIGVLLGNGFYNEQGGRYSKMLISFGPPTLLVELTLRYADGSQERICSDSSWTWKTSPLLFNDMYGGEDYDARLEEPGWNLPGCKNSGWKPVVVQQKPAGRLVPQIGTPVQCMQTLPAQHVNAVDSCYVYDMAQNLAGFPQITVSGKAGSKIRLTPSENLRKNGSANQSQSGAPYYYEYTLRGNGKETWHPRFSYYGYRYVQINGAVAKGRPNPQQLPVVEKIQSCFVHNAAPQAGSFECSNDIFNQAHRIIVNAIKSNMQAVFTDCPHREKLGWLEQMHLNGPGLFYNFDLSTMIPKIMQDISDAQLANGLVPDIAPEYVVFDNGFRDSPEWGCSAVFLPFMYARYYGDRRLITTYYDTMKRYADYLTTMSKDGILSHGLGDWCDYNLDQPYGVSQNTPVPLSATAHYYMVIDCMTKAAAICNRSADEQRYTELREKIRRSFNHTFFHPDTQQYGTGSQASNAMALFAGLVNENDRAAVLRNLVKNIKERGYRLSTGDVGNRYLFQTLADNDLNEIMYRMHNHMEVPGYGFQLKFGATTLTELWDPRMGASWNHFMMGQIEEWFYKSLAGIDTAEGNGFSEIVIRPQVVGDLRYVKASHRTLYGTVSVYWQRTAHRFSLSIDIPANCTAKVYLPHTPEPIAVGSGNYTFEKTLP